MNTIKDAMFQPIFESVMDSHIQYLLSTIKKNGMNAKQVLIGWNGAIPLIDQIDPSMIHIYRNLQGDFEHKLDRMIKDKGKDSNCMIVCCIKNEPVAVIHLWDVQRGYEISSSRHIEYIVNTHEIKPNSWGSINLERGKNLLKDDPNMSTSKSSSWAHVICRHCNELWVIDMSDIPMKKVADIRKERYDAKAGMIEMNEETFKKIVKNNQNRYNLLAQKMRDQKGDVAKQIMERVNKIIQKTFETLTDFRINMKNLMSYPTFERMSTEVRTLAEYQERLIDAVNRAVTNEINIRKSEKNGEQGYFGVDYYTKQIDERNKQIIIECENCEGYENSIKQLMSGKSNADVPLYTPK